MGTPRETLARIAGPNYGINRILGQLAFALKLSEAHNGKYDAVIGGALDVLDRSLEKQGVLTRDACKESENALLPLSGAAKEYVVLCASHAHIDMNWMWGWQETVAAALATFRTILSLMKEYPEFTFSQSQASVYRIVEEYDPELMEEIRQRIKEGRWEVTASSWVETDKNMPCTESLLRHIRYTKDYLSAAWGVDPDSLDIDFSPDTFGHSANIPEIDTYGGVKYLYHCRGFDERYILYRWRAPSGTEILGHCEPFWYNSGINPDIGIGAPEIASLCGGLKTSLIVYGVGDHGGGPSRRDIETIIEMQDWPIFPKVKFGTIREYFRTAESVRDKIPIIDREINFVMAGCYTTQSRIKLGNRRGEAALLDAETLDTLGLITAGKRYPQTRFIDAWRDLLFTHFHDILTGSCVRDSREYAMGIYANVMATAQTMREKAAIHIAEQIDTSAIEIKSESGSQSEGAGVGYGIENYSGMPNPERGSGATRIYHAFNPTACGRSETVELTVWDWNYDLGRIEVAEAGGNTLPFQLLDREQRKYWDHHYIRVIAQAEIPAFGYTTLVVREAEMGKQYPFFFHPFPRTDTVHDPIILENEFLKATFNPETGALCSLFDKESGTEQIASGKSAGLVLNWAEKGSNDAWHIGRYLAHEQVEKATRILPSTGNRLRDTLEVEQEILASKLKTTITLDKNSRSLSYSFTVIWNEIADMYDKIPVLCFSIPLKAKPEFYQSDIPGGAQKRPGGFQDIPGLQYTAAVNGQRALALITDCKYGYRGNEGNLSVTLINTACRPDPYPERGEHNIRLWITPSSSDPRVLEESANACCHPVNVISGVKHKGKLPLKKELLKYESASTVVSSLGSVSDDTILARGYETAGKEDKVSITVPFAVKEARLVDLNGKTSDADIAVNGSTVAFDVAPHRIFGVLIRMAG